MLIGPKSCIFGRKFSAKKKTFGQFSDSPEFRGREQLAISPALRRRHCWEKYVLVYRECQTDDESRSDSCRSMCCGRGYTTRQVDVRYRCECKYYWCCYVKCKTCTKTVQVNRCQWMSSRFKLQLFGPSTLYSPAILSELISRPGPFR